MASAAARCDCSGRSSRSVQTKSTRRADCVSFHPENYWGQYVRQVVQMYKGRIDTWIIWNEPDITPDAPNAAYFIWAGSPADYYQLLKVAYLNAKEVNP